MAVPYILSQPLLDANFAFVVAPSGVSAGTYGSSTQVAQVTVDARGRITSASNVTISGASTLSGTVATTDATVTTIITAAIASNTTALLTLRIVARRTGGASGTAGDGAAYQLMGAVKNIAGTASIISQSIAFSGEDQAAWTVDLLASTSNILVRVTGAAANNISWSASGQILAV